MPRTTPGDPELVAATIAALRALASDRQGDAFEQDVVGRLRKAGAEPAVAARLVARFDGLDAVERERAIGPAAGGVLVRGSRAPIVDAGSGSPPGLPPEPTMASPADPPPSGITSVAGTVRLAGWGRAREAMTGSEVRVDEQPTVSDGQSTDTQTYSIDYTGFHCESEGGLTSVGSDEVYVVTSAVWISPDGVNSTTDSIKHPVGFPYYEDVDDGETRLGPVARCWTGQLFPVTLVVAAWDHDTGDPDTYRDEIDVIVKAAIAIALYATGAGATLTAAIESLSGFVTDVINWVIDTGDDQVGHTRTVVLDMAEMDEMGKRPTSPWKGTTTLFGDFFTEHEDEGAHYVFGFELGRSPRPMEREVIIL